MEGERLKGHDTRACEEERLYIFACEMDDGLG